jgi:hypothetical protein
MAAEFEFSSRQLATNVVQRFHRRKWGDYSEYGGPAQPWQEGLWMREQGDRSDNLPAGYWAFMVSLVCFLYLVRKLTKETKRTKQTKQTR